MNPSALPFALVPPLAPVFQESDGSWVLAPLCCGLLLIGLLAVLVLWLLLRSGRRKKSSRQPLPQATPQPAPAEPVAGLDATILRQAAPADVAPAPAPALGWQLVVTQGPDAGRRYALAGPARIGRDPENEIQLQDGQVSRQHAHLEPEGDAFYLADLGSANGTYVNGTRIAQSVWLAPGDTIQVGDSYLQVQVINGRIPGQAAAPPIPPAPVVTAPVTAQAAPATGEPVLAVLPALERRKGLMGSQAFNLVITPHRLIFARLTSSMLQAAAKEAKEAAKADGKGFLGQWGATFDANGSICRRYADMPAAGILAENSDNFVIPINQLSRVQIRKGSFDVEDGSSDPDRVIFHTTGGKQTFSLKGTNAGQAKKILRSALGDIVR